MLILSPNPVSQEEIRRQWEQLQWTEYKPHPQGLYFDRQMQPQVSTRLRLSLDVKRED